MSIPADPVPTDDAAGESEELIEHKHVLDTNLRDELAMQTWRAHNLAEKGGLYWNVLTAKVRQSVHEAMSDRIVTSNTEKDLMAHSYTEPELYRVVLPRAPGASITETPEEESARKKVARVLWDIAAPAHDGYVQSRYEGTGLVLIESPVPRLVKTSGDDGIPDKPKGRYLTANHELLRMWCADPARRKLLRLATSLGTGTFHMLSQRQPTMRRELAEALTATLKQVTAALPQHDIKAVMAQLAAEAETAADEEPTA